MLQVNGTNTFTSVVPSDEGVLPTTAQSTPRELPRKPEAPEKDSYSISECAKLLKKSAKSVQGYKALVLKAFAKDLDRVIHANKTLTAEGFVQLKKAAQFIGKSNSEGYLKAVYQANPHLEQLIEEKVEKTSDSSTVRKVADPFEGISARGAIVPVSMTANDSSALARTIREKTELTIQSSESFNSGMVQSLVAGADDLGVQLGEFLAQRTIDSAEATKQARLNDYIAAQGVTVKKAMTEPEESHSV